MIQQRSLAQSLALGSENRAPSCARHRPKHSILSYALQGGLSYDPILEMKKWRYGQFGGKSLAPIASSAQDKSPGSLTLSLSPQARALRQPLPFSRWRLV